MDFVPIYSMPLKADKDVPGHTVGFANQTSDRKTYGRGSRVADSINQSEVLRGSQSYFWGVLPFKRLLSII